MAGTKINEATLRETLKGTENIPIVDTDLPKGRTTAAKLKEYVQPDLSGYATKTELNGKVDKTTYDSDKKTFASKTEIPDISNKADKVTVVDHGTNDTTFTLTPNVLHKWGEVATLTLTLGTPTDGVVNEYMAQFVSGTTATVLTLPETVKWIGDNTIEAGKTYQLSIIDNLAVLGGA